MTDNEIIKALECCTTNSCDGCPIDKFKVLGTGNCISEILTVALDLINRQKAEIERYKSGTMANAEVVKALTNELKTAKSEAIKEFAERLKKKTSIHKLYGMFIKYVAVYNIDNLVKEMTEKDFKEE